MTAKSRENRRCRLPVPSREGVDDLPSAPMPRARAAAFLAAAAALVVLAALGTRPVPAADAGAVTPTTTIAPDVTTTTTAAGIPTTTTAPVAVRRGGAEAGSIAKPEDEPWSARRLVTTTALCVVALASAGYAYGRIRSAPPRHPDLVHEPPEY
jgi:hypothetical protein